ncbi:rhomboid family intramembrane serine protease [Agreia sp.]|uniref:rhomboid family intramembrane serine protease n=1 Tax=Agreia sp. TaxID=1872416 RepID=UPI0035BBF39A
MSQAPVDADNFCYRHPDRQSFILCQRCGKTVCPDCQVQAAVGVHCVDCARQNRPVRPKPRFVTAFRRTSTQPVVTYSLIGVTAFFFVLQSVPGIGSLVTQALQYAGAYTQPGLGVPVEPWRMITSVFLHGGILHLLFNMYALFVFGQMLEHTLGRARYLALYLLAGLGGSVAVDLIAVPFQGVVGASGAIFGLMGAYFVIQRHLGATNIQLLVLVGINLVIGFIPGFGIAWQAHLGGLAVGALIGLIFTKTRNVRQKNTQILLLVATGASLVALTVAKALV